MNSARVVVPAPLWVHCNWPPQSPVAHDPLPELSKVSVPAPISLATPVVPPATPLPSVMACHSQSPVPFLRK